MENIEVKNLEFVDTSVSKNLHESMKENIFKWIIKKKTITGEYVLDTEYKTILNRRGVNIIKYLRTIEDWNYVNDVSYYAIKFNKTTDCNATDDILRKMIFKGNYFKHMHFFIKSSALNIIYFLIIGKVYPDFETIIAEKKDYLLEQKEKKEKIHLYEKTIEEKLQSMKTKIKVNEENIEFTCNEKMDLEKKNLNVIKNNYNSNMDHLLKEIEITQMKKKKVLSDNLENIVENTNNNMNSIKETIILKLDESESHATNLQKTQRKFFDEKKEENKKNMDILNSVKKEILENIEKAKKLHKEESEKLEEKIKEYEKKSENFYENLMLDLKKIEKIYQEKITDKEKEAKNTMNKKYEENIKTLVKTKSEIMENFESKKESFILSLEKSQSELKIKTEKMKEIMKKSKKDFDEEMKEFEKEFMDRLKEIGEIYEKQIEKFTIDINEILECPKLKSI
jgi:hypothetical protein